MGHILPSKMYKYLPIEDYVFPNPSLRYTPPEELNDPHEFIPALEYPLDQLAEIARENGKRLSPSQLEQWAVNLEEDAGVHAVELFRNLSKVNHIGILSMTDDPLNNLMWSHYASSHQGVVFEIDITHSNFGPKDGFYQFRPVKYAAQRPVASLNPSVEEMLLWLTTKSKAWTYEREYRQVTGIVDRLLYFKNVKGTVPLPPQTITKVYIGLGTKDDFLTKALDFCAHHKIPCGRVRADPKEYKLLPPVFQIL